MIEYLKFILPLVIEYRYLAVFAALTVAGLGVPLPEEVTIVISGYMVATGRMDFWFTFFVCYSGVIAGDLVTYFLGRYTGRWFLGTWIMKWIVSRKRLAQAQYYYRRYGPRALLVARQAPGIRFPAFFTAGMLKMRLFDFLKYDSAAGLISMPVVYIIAYTFGPRITSALALVVKIGDITTQVLLGLAGLVGLSWLVYYLKYKKEQTSEE
ncbi:MAG: DedA family protein [bacterium]